MKLSLEQMATSFYGSVTFETGSICQGVSIKWDNWYFFQLLEATMYSGRKWLLTSRKSLGWWWSGT